MEMLTDDFRRLPDGSIDYDFYCAKAAELHREERDRVLKDAVLGAARFIRRAATAPFRLFSSAGRLGSAHH
jgi:hypothetical protein